MKMLLSNKLIACFLSVLVAAEPVLFVYFKNATTIPVNEIWIPIIINLVLIVILYLGGVVLFAKAEQRFAMAVGIIFIVYLVGFSGDGLVHVVGEGFVIADRIVIGSNKILIPLVFLLILFWYFFIRKFGTHVKRIAIPALSVMCVLFAIDIWSFKYKNNTNIDVQCNVKLLDVNIKMKPGNMPNIYLLIPDSYPSNDVLLRYYNFDNSFFVDSLKCLGFSLPKNIYANYPLTIYSMSSFLNMEYLHELVGNQFVEKQSILELLITKNRVFDFFLKSGYRLYIADNNFFRWSNQRDSGNDNVEVLDITSNYFLNPLAATVVSKTPLSPLVKNLNLQIKKNEILKSFRLVDSIASKPSPKFVMFHFDTPHPPYVLAKSGQFSLQTDQLRFIQQVEETNHLLLKAVCSLMKNDTNNKIVLIMSDHGSPSHYKWDGLDPSFIRSRMPIFYAIYTSPTIVMKNLFQDGGSSVNVFRKIIGYLSSDSLMLLPDSAYMLKSLLDHQMINCTEVVKGYY